MKLKLDSQFQKYQVDWAENDLYDNVYLHIEPIEPVKMVKGDKLTLDFEMHKHMKEIPVFKSMQRNWIQQKMANTTYEFTLYCKQEEEGILDEQEAYWGLKEKIYMNSRSCGERMREVFVKCRIKISEEWFWLEHSDFNGKLQFHLPPMEKEKNMFQTSCFAREEVCDKLELCFDQRIDDYFEIIK